MYWQKLLTSCPLTIYLRDGQLHISINLPGMNTNFISLFLHIYVSICNFSLAEVIFATETSTNHLV